MRPSRTPICSQTSTLSAVSLGNTPASPWTATIAARRCATLAAVTAGTYDIVRITKSKLAALSDRISADIRTGTNMSLPFDDGYFDYLLSWNACYYMQDDRSNIRDHIAEYARVAKPGAWLVASVPAPGCFSLIGAEPLGSDLIRIRTDSKWDMLNGTIYHQFKSWNDIESRFGTHFGNFQKCMIKDDCYGLPLEYFVFVCQKIVTGDRQ